MTSGEHHVLRRYPRLYHVTDAAAVPLIRAHGLMSAEALCDLFEVPPRRRDALLTQNRDEYASLEHPARGKAELRLQYMREEALRRQLDPAITPAEWRRLVNGQVHFWPRPGSAGRLAAYEGKRTQVVLTWETADLVAAGVPLFICRWNNGTTVNRQRPGSRLRTWSDYVPLCQFVGGHVAEIVARTAVPSSLPFN